MSSDFTFLVIPPRLIAAVLLIVAIPVTVAICRFLQRHDVLDRFQANFFIAAGMVMIGLGLFVVAVVDQIGYPPGFD